MSERTMKEALEGLSLPIQEGLPFDEAKPKREWNLFERLAAITNELGFVKKNLSVKLPTGAYKAVGEVDVLEAVKPLEYKYGIYSYPIERRIVTDKETVTKSGTTNQFIRVETVYRFVNVTKPEEYIDVVSYGDGVDSGDKASGKAMTYADKYALMKGYKISTGDDPDQTASEEQKTITEISTSDQHKRILDLLDHDDSKVEHTMKSYKVEKLMDLTHAQAVDIITKMEAWKNKRK